MRSDRLTEITKRSEAGPFVREKDFDMQVAQSIPELVREYGLEFDPHSVVPADDDMADRLYGASLQLVADLGVYNMDTQRIIQFAREEIRSAVAAAPSEVTLGCGKDAVVMRHRGVEGCEPCIIHSGPTGTPVSERYYPQIMASCAQEPLIDCLGAGSVSTYRGERIIPGSPLEILRVQADACLLREAARQAGRPGMHLNDVASPLTCQGKISAVNKEWGLRPTDGLLVSQMVELKTNYDQLSRAAYLQSAGMHVVDLMTPLVGGLGGGAEGTAIVTVASHLCGVLLYSASYHVYGHMHLLKSTDTDREGLWIYSVGGQALARNTPILSIDAIYTQAGLGTDEVLWEVAAASIATTVAGLHQGGVGAKGGSQEDHTSGLENRFNAQVSRASLGLTREQANELVLACVGQYENTHNDPAPGKPFAELYNLDTMQPTDEWEGCYERVCRGLAGLGLPLG